MNGSCAAPINALVFILGLARGMVDVGRKPIFSPSASPFRNILPNPQVLGGIILFAKLTLTPRRVAAFIQGRCSLVQESVVALVWADNEVGGFIVSFVFVDMMDDNAKR